jgi:hypothetical protein
MGFWGAIGSAASGGMSGETDNSSTAMGANDTGITLDHSGWTVATGGSNATATRSNEMSDIARYALLGIGAIVLIFWISRKKK